MSRKRTLIICNDDYTHQPLSSCLENADKLVATFQQDKSCKIDYEKNLVSADLSKKIFDFVVSMEPNDIAIFYFSGYLTTWRDQIYLLGINNHDIRTVTSLQHYGVNVQALIDDLVERNTKCILFILDCYHTDMCSALSSNTASDNRRSNALNRIEIHGKLLFLSVCETTPVSSVSSKQATRGEFTKHLLKHLITPKITITTIFNNAIQDFINENNNRSAMFKLSNFCDEIFSLEDELRPKTGENCQSKLKMIDKNTSASSLNTNAQPRVHIVPGAIQNQTLNQLLPTPGQAVVLSDALTHTNRTNLQNDILRRRVVGQNCQLGSLYDIGLDKVVKPAEKYYAGTNEPVQRSTCTVFPADPSTDLSDYLKKMDYDDAIRQSLLFGVIQPSGVSSFLTYDREVNEYTRFLYYSYTHKIAELNSINGTGWSALSDNCHQNATHSIVGIESGFEILCVIQTQDRKSCEQVDELLQSVKQGLEAKDNKVKVASEHLKRIYQMADITTYTSKFGVPKKPTDNVFTEIDVWIRDPWSYVPLVYRLKPLNRETNGSAAFMMLCTPGEINSIEKLESLVKEIKLSKRKLEQIMTKCSQKDYKPVIEKQWQQPTSHFSRLVRIYQEFLEKCKQTVPKFRRSASETNEIDSILSHENYKTLKVELDQMHQSIENDLFKTALVLKLKKYDIQYKDILEYLPKPLDQSTFEKIHDVVKTYFTNTSQPVVLCYSTDQLIHKKQMTWEVSLADVVTKTKNKNKKATIIYVDVTQYEEVLLDFKIITLPEEKRQVNLSVPSSEINVLLLGETGVGKSTFINAFANYLMFKTLEEAEQGEPIVVVPIYYSISVGDRFEEKNVRWGDADPNENYQNPGQSVTQHCQSYMFDLVGGRKLRLIDTPGIGDTRGFVQDQINMDHIMTYINQLTHINAICLLLKPTATKIDVFFRLCILQLVKYLNPNGYRNIIFCFTNSRSTMYSPGNTGTLVKQLLKDENLESIAVSKNNTFCFDDEAFRYLAGKSNNIQFGEYIKQESVVSWLKSVVESRRLIQLIEMLPAFDLNKEQSLMKAALDISMLARPLIEILRLRLYNWKLAQNKSTYEIMIAVNSVPTKICSSCAENGLVKIGLVFMVQYESSKREERTSCVCSCGSNHFFIEYTVIYESKLRANSSSTEKLLTLFTKLFARCGTLAHFLKQNGLSVTEDPMLRVLSRFIDEQDSIRKTVQNVNHVQEDIFKTMSTVRQQWEKNVREMKEKNRTFSLAEVYQIIDELMEEPDLKQQIECIKKTRRLLMDRTERPVHIPSKTF